MIRPIVLTAFLLVCGCRHARRLPEGVDYPRACNPNAPIFTDE
jgi:hypothetical protein